MASMPWPPQPDVKRSFRPQPRVTVLSVGSATAPAISLADRIAPLALVPRTPAMGTVITLCAATAFSPRGCRASYGRRALGGAGSVTNLIGTEARAHDRRGKPADWLPEATQDDPAAGAERTSSWLTR